MHTDLDIVLSELNFSLEVVVMTVLCLRPQVQICQQCPTYFYIIIIIKYTRVFVSILELCL